MANIILVPSTDNVPLRLPVQERVIYRHTPEVPNDTVERWVELPPGLVQSEINDYWEWYGHLYETTIRFDDIPSMFWTLADLRRGIDCICKGTVLVQRNASSSRWRILIVEPEDYIAFSKWLSTQRINYIDLPYSPEREYEVHQWLTENVKSPRRLTRLSNTIRVAIQDDVEAVHFKLRWFNVDEKEGDNL